MSTYTDLHLRKKENLTILRMPGNPYDGITPQRVIFENPENIYNGKFIGELSTTSASFNDVQLNDCTVIGGVLSNVAFKFGNDEELDLATLTSNISEMSENINSLQNFQTSAEISCQNLSLNLNKLGLSVEQLSTNVNDLSNSLNIAIDHIDALSDSISNAISSNEDLSNALSNLSIDFNNYAISSKQSISTISNDLSGLSDEFIDYVDLNDKSISTISNDLSGLSDEFVSYREDTDDKIDSLQKQIQGGLTYQQSLLIDNNIYDYTLSHLFIENGIESYSILSIGYFYIAQTQPEHRISSYIYDGVELEHGDWLLITKNCYVSSMTSNDVDVLNAQDFDSFKLNNDNIALGNNEFNGNTIFNGDISSFGTALFQNGLTSNSISSKSLSVDIADIKHLNIELSNIDYGISSLQDLSNDIYNKIVNAQNTANDATNTANSAIISVQCFSNELSNKADISSISTGYLMSNDVNISYHDHTIWLSAQTYVTSVDCTDFIKDGMLSTVELCGTMLIMNFNTDAGSDPISVDLSNFVDNYDGKISSLSNAIDSKIFISNKISGISGYSDLSIIKLPIDEYAVLLSTGNALSNALYVIEDNYIDAYGQQIKNVALPTDLSDAATKGYVDDSISNISIPTDLSDLTNSPGFLVSNDLSDYCYAKTETSSAIEISAELSGKADVSATVLNLIYDGNGEQFSEWTYVGLNDSETVISMTDNGDGTWTLITSKRTYTDYQQTSPTLVNFDDEVTATRTENHVIGYTLGDQDDKPLQPKGDYELTANMQSDVSSIVLSTETTESWDYQLPQGVTEYNYQILQFYYSDSDMLWELRINIEDVGDFDWYSQQPSTDTNIVFDEGPGGDTFGTAYATKTTTTRNALGLAMLSDLSAKQDKLSDPQISAINSIVDERRTAVKFYNNEIRYYDVAEELTQAIRQGWEIDIGSTVKEVKIGNSVTSIGSFAFSYCDGLTSMTIPDHVTRIESAAFVGCTNLASVTIGNSVTSIGDYVFQDCRGLMSVTIPDSVTNISIYAFGSCTNLTSVTIPSSVTSIETGAFESCIGLTSVTIPDSVTSIGEYAFRDCTNLANITVVGKKQVQAEALLSDAVVPSGCEITTWNDASQEWVKDQNYLSSVPTTYKTYQETSSLLSNDGYVLSIDVDTLISSISTDLSIDYVNKINDLSIENYAQLSDISKVFIKNPDSTELSNGAKSDLSVIKLTTEEYAQILSSHEGAQPNALYVISSNNINAYGQNIKNVAPAVNLSDAVNLEQLSNAMSSIDMSNFLDKRTGGEVSGDVKILSGNYIQTSTPENVYIYGSNSFIQAESTAKYGSASIGSRGFIVIGVVSAENKVILSVDGLSNVNDCIPESYYTNVWSIALDNYLDAQFSEISTVGADYVIFKNALKATASYNGKELTAFIDLLNKKDDNALYCPTHPEVGNCVIQTFNSNHIEGGSTHATAQFAHAEGRSTFAEGRYSHAEGHGTIAAGTGAHAEGMFAKTLANLGAHAEGYNTIALGNYGSHAEGYQTSALQGASHAEGYLTKANNVGAHVEGGGNGAIGGIANGFGSHAEGQGTFADGNWSHAEGQQTSAIGDYSHSSGFKTHALSAAAYAEGYQTYSEGIASHAEGYQTSALNYRAHAEGQFTKASGPHSHSEGLSSSATNNSAHAEGQETIASGKNAHAEGFKSESTSEGAHAEGGGSGVRGGIASGIGSHAEGRETNATAAWSHAEGCMSQATAEGAHAEGGGNGYIGGTATGYGSHAEGYNTQAKGNWSHAEGHTTMVSGVAGHSSGIKANALHDYSYVWNGDSSASISSIISGSFTINPKNGISGFYIGSQNLNEIIDNKTSNINIEIKDIIANALSSAGILANTQLSDITLGNVISAMYNLCQSMS